MRNFFSYLIKKLASTLLITAVLFTLAYCLITGEFPPKVENMKTGLANLQAQIQQVKKIQEARLKAALVAQEAAATDIIAAETNPLPGSSLGEPIKIHDQQALWRKIDDLEKRVLQLEKQQR